MMTYKVTLLYWLSFKFEIIMYQWGGMMHLNSNDKQRLFKNENITAFTRERFYSLLDQYLVINNA